MKTAFSFQDRNEPTPHVSRAQSLAQQEAKLFRAANLKANLWWFVVIATMVALAIPTGAFLTEQMSFSPFICYSVAFCLHLALAVCIDRMLISVWKPSQQETLWYGFGTLGFVLLLVGLGIWRYNIYVADGSADQLNAAAKAIFWFLMELLLPAVCGAVLAGLSDEAKRRHENNERFVKLTEHIEADPKHGDKSFDDFISIAHKEHTEAQRQTPNAKKKIDQLQYVVNMLRLYHPDKNVHGETHDDEPDYDINTLKNESWIRRQGPNNFIEMD